MRSLQNPRPPTALLVLALTCVAAYSSTVWCDFVAGDRQFLLHNPNLPDAARVFGSFFSDYWAALGGDSFAYYRPLTVLVHALDVWLYGLWPGGHHLTNVALHLCATVLVWRLILQLLPGAGLPALAGAVLFCVHPVHTHAVVYVMGRTDILATIGFLVALGAALRPQPGFGSLALVGGGYLLGLLCKEIAITLPLVTLLCRYMLRSRLPWGRRALVRVLLPMAAALGCYIALRTGAIGVLSPAAFPDGWYSLVQRAGLVVVSLGYYGVKLVLPVSLCFYGNLVVPAGLGGVLATGWGWAGIATLALLALSVGCRLWLRFPLAWFCITLLPVLNIVALPALAKENYLYLPSVGAALLIARMLATAVRPRIAGAGVVLLAGVLLVLTWIRIGEYRDPVVFLEATVARMPVLTPAQRDDRRYFEGAKNWYTTWRNLGRLYLERGDGVRAETALRAALTALPVYADARYRAEVHESLGVVYLRQGRLQSAGVELSQALPHCRRPWYVYNLLGVVSWRQGDAATARSCWQQALRLRPQYGPARKNLAGASHMPQGSAGEAGQP